MFSGTSRAADRCIVEVAGRCIVEVADIGNALPNI
jgi:hypothetical protein